MIQPTVLYNAQRDMKKTVFMSTHTPINMI